MQSGIGKHTVTLRPLHQRSPKKRKADNDAILYLSDHEFADALEKIAGKIWTRLNAQKATDASSEKADRLRDEMREGLKEVQMHFSKLFDNAMAKMQAEAGRRAEAMLQRVMQGVKHAKQITNSST